MTDTPAKVLVVDDHNPSRLKMSMAVKRLGHEVELAADGAEALKMMSLSIYDLMLLDIEMPELDGYGVLKELRKSPEFQNIPVIVISAVDDIESICQAIELGAADYLPKSFNPILLKSRISACLEKKRWRDQEVAYLDDVAKLTFAAAQLENPQWSMSDTQLQDVEGRQDELGNLARIFRKMTAEIWQRENALKQQVEDLKIRIDRSRQTEKVTQITGTSYFKDLASRAHALRDEVGKTKKTSKD